MPVFLLATLDTKGVEARFVAEVLARSGVEVCLVDCGCLGGPTFPADIPRDAVFQAAGTTLAAEQARLDRGRSIQAAAAGATALVLACHARGEVDGVLGLGGSAGTTIGTAVMRSLPIGLPKVMVSTLAAGQCRSFVVGKDVFMLNAVADVAGLNRISRPVLSQAAWAMAGLVHGRAAEGKVGTVGTPDGEFGVPPQRQTYTRSDGLAETEDSSQLQAPKERPLVAASMFGVTTPCVEEARRILEDAGYEVVVFHATGAGGETMESLIRDRVFAGVLDVTTTELADELVGGILSAGPTRLTAAAQSGIPQVISVGALDMVNFGPRSSVPEKFTCRSFVEHNAHVTLMRTTPAENALLGAEIGRKAAASTGPVAIFLPASGVSALDAPGKAFDDPAARDALFAGIRAAVSGSQVELIDRPEHLNDPSFAAALAARLLEMMAAAKR